MKKNREFLNKNNASKILKNKDLQILSEDQNTKKDFDKDIQKVKDVEKMLKFDIEGKFLLIRVGSKEHPADTDDIENVEEKVRKLLDDYGINCAALVTHHEVDVSIIS